MRNRMPQSIANVKPTKNYKEKVIILNSATNTLLNNLIAAMKDFYDKELREKVAAGLRRNAQACRFNGGRVPFGYRTNSKHEYEIDPQTAKTVEEIFIRYSNGESVKDIQRALESIEGVVLSADRIRSLLKNRIYIGEYHYKDTVIAGGVPAIVSQELFDKAQRLGK